MLRSRLRRVREPKRTDEPRSQAPEAYCSSTLMPEAGFVGAPSQKMHFLLFWFMLDRTIELMRPQMRMRLPTLARIGL